MKHIDFYLDFISPFAYLAFEHLPDALEGLSYSVAYKPVLFGALLKQNGQLGPAEIPAKRSWTYRHVLWLGHANGIPLEMPAAHPYNPLPHLRLALTTTADGCINRHVAETIFRQVWRGGADAGDAARLAALAAQLEPQQRLRQRQESGDGDDKGDGRGVSPEDHAKAQLKRNTDEAVALGIFGVPAFRVDGRLFWGFDSLPMLRAYLGGDAWFDGPQWEGADQRPIALQRTNR